MKTLLNFRNIFVAIVLSLLVCHNSTATSTDSPVSLNLYDIQGRLVKNINSNTNLPAGLNTYQIDTNDLPKGMYICHLIANKTAVAKKVVK